MSLDGYLTAKREYCAACGGLLGSARYLVQSKLTGRYEAVHHSDHCRSLYAAHNQPDQFSATDTSGTPPGARQP